jgi:thioesterase domain-containing protein
MFRIDGPPQASIEIVAVDFPGGRRQAGFAQFVSGLEDTRLTAFVAPRDGAAIESPTGYLEMLDSAAADLGETQPRVRCVAGFCASAGLALHVASALERAHRRVDCVLLVEPTRVTPQTVEQEYSDLLARHDQANGELPSSLMAMVQTIERAQIAFGIPEVAATQLRDRYRAWLAFLNAAAMCDSSTGTGPIISYHANGSEEDSLYIARGVAVTRSFATPMDQLLDSDQVREYFRRDLETVLDTNSQ